MYVRIYIELDWARSSTLSRVRSEWRNYKSLCASRKCLGWTTARKEDNSRLWVSQHIEVEEKYNIDITTIAGTSLIVCGRPLCPVSTVTY